jgi:hypothetical protein
MSASQTGESDRKTSTRPQDRQTGEGALPPLPPRAMGSGIPKKTGLAITRIDLEALSGEPAEAFISLRG